jgi:hypothetical protein
MKSTLGKKALIKELGKIGIVTKVDAVGTPVQVTVDKKVIDVVYLTVEIIGYLKSLFLLIKSIFSKK